MKTQKSNSVIFKGQVLLMSVLLLSSISVLAITLANVYLRSLRLTSQTLDSVKALYAADAAIECGLFEIFNETTNICAELNMENNTSFIVPSEEIPVGPGQFRIIQAEGIHDYSRVRRSMEAILGY